MATAWRQGRIAKGALFLSCTLHIALLGVLAVVDFSSTPSQLFADSLPAISVKDITAVTQLSQAMPKPKIAPAKKSDASQQDKTSLPNVIAKESSAAASAVGFPWPSSAGPPNRRPVRLRTTPEAEGLFLLLRPTSGP